METLESIKYQIEQYGGEYEFQLVVSDDCYYWVATKTCVVRAIPKDVFAKAGLVSCLDYYNEGHLLKLC